MGGHRPRDGVTGLLAVFAVAIAALGAGGCGASSPHAAVATLGASSSSAAEVRLLRATSEDPPAPFVTDRALVGRRDGQPIKLNKAASPALFGWTSPLAVPSPDGHLVAYSAWQDLVAVDHPEESYSQHGIQDGDALGRPSVQVVDVDTGKDSLIEDGAYSVAWRADGALAYVKGDPADFRANAPYTSNIVVRRSVDAQSQVWTTTLARYIVVAWAGDTLLAYEMQEGEQLDLLALSGPGSSRILATDALLVAVSPDGTRALVSDASGTATRLLDVASGEEVARLDPDPPVAGAPAAERLSYGGSWTGDRVVAESAGGLVVLRATDSALSVERTLAVPADVLPLGVHEPQFADAAGTRVSAWAPVPGSGGRAAGHQYVYVDCDIADATCSLGPPRSDRVFSHTYNPSRPESHR